MKRLGMVMPRTWKAAGNWAFRKAGGRTQSDVADAYQKGTKTAFNQGSDTYANMGAKISQDAGKIVGAAGEGAGKAITRGASAFKQAAQDNPGGLGVAAGAAGLGALALSKLMRRRKAQA